MAKKNQVVDPVIITNEMPAENTATNELLRRQRQAAEKSGDVQRLSDHKLPDQRENSGVGPKREPQDEK
jgi:hypothetical protein